MSRLRPTAISVLFVLAIVACGDAGAGTTPEPESEEPVVLYSGRTEELVAPLIDRFEIATGTEVDVRYGSSPEMAATLLTEGTNSPADLFYAQDPASLGSVAELMEPLPDSILSLVPDTYRDPSGMWTGITVRSRVLAFNPELVSEDELPTTYKHLVDPKWSGLVGVAPTNGSFVAFVSAMLILEGEDATLEWLEGLAANDPITFDGNAPIAAAVDAGDIAVGLINHYYLLELAAEQGGRTAKNHFFSQPDAGSLVMPSGISVLATASNRSRAEELIAFLLSPESQAYFADSNFEFPVAEGVPAPAGAPPLSSLVSPSVSTTDMAAVLDRATDLITEAGLV
ncbi:MAG: extracellular solute-binding protein [Acidimicrobiia bacterium]